MSQRRSVAELEVRREVDDGIPAAANIGAVVVAVDGDDCFASRPAVAASSSAASENCCTGKTGGASAVVVAVSTLSRPSATDVRHQQSPEQLLHIPECFFLT